MPGVFAQGSQEERAAAGARLEHIPQSFAPPENRELIDLIRAAKSLGEKVRLDPGFSWVTIRRFGPEAVRSGDDLFDVPMVNADSDVSGLCGFQRWIVQFQQGLGPSVGTSNYPGDHPLKSPAAGSELKDAVLIRGALASKGPASVNPIGVYLDVEPGRARLTVINHLTGLVLFQRSIEGFEGDAEALAAEVRGAVSRYDFNADCAALPSPTREEQARWSAMWAFKPAASGEVKAKTGVVAAEWRHFPVSLSVTALPAYFAWDRGFSEDAVMMDVDAKAMAAGDHRPIVVRSRGGFSISISGRELREAGVRFPLFPLSRPLHMAGIDGSPTGVRIQPDSSGYTIYVPPAFATGPDEPRLRPVVLDFSLIGLPSIRHTFYQEVLPVVEQQGVYAVYADGGRGVVDPNRSRIAAVGQGAAEVERAFGREPGAVVQRLYVPDTMDKNLAVSDPSRIDIYDESLTLDPSAMRIFGRHEAMHSYDFDYRISDDRAFSGLFDRLMGGDGRFFDFINEKRFYGCGFGGHAQDNARELFATLGNTVYDPNVIRKVREAPRAVREQYVEALRATRMAIAYAIGRREVLDPISAGVAPMNAHQGPVPLVARIDAVLGALDPSAVPTASPRD